MRIITGTIIAMRIPRTMVENDMLKGILSWTNAKSWSSLPNELILSSRYLPKNIPATAPTISEDIR